MQTNLNQPLVIEVEAEPKPAPRPRYGNRKAYNPPEYTAYKKLVGQAAKRALKGLGASTAPLALEAVFKRRYKTDSRRFGDVDNLVKGVMDALIGIVFVDDAQVVKLTAQKEKSQKSGLLVKVTFQPT